jgi:hypothetical protein
MDKSEKKRTMAAFPTKGAAQSHLAGMCAAFVRKLADLSDGDGSLLDRSLILYGSNMSDSHAHDHCPRAGTRDRRQHGRMFGGLIARRGAEIHGKPPLPAHSGTNDDPRGAGRRATVRSNSVLASPEA